MTDVRCGGAPYSLEVAAHGRDEAAFEQCAPARGQVLTKPMRSAGKPRKLGETCAWRRRRDWTGARDSPLQDEHQRVRPCSDTEAPSAISLTVLVAARLFAR